jgi:CBS domain-containing protein
MKVVDLMQKDVRSIDPEATVAEIVEALADAHVSGLPVVDSTGRVVGVVSATDILQAEAEQADAKSRARLFSHTTARDLMTRDVYMIEPDAEARQAAQQMLYGEVKRLFVQEKGRLVGVISQTDLAQAFAKGRL